MSRDPRHDHNSPFTTASNMRIASGRDLEPWVRFDQVDSVDETLIESDIIARKEGLIRLDVNFRTKSGLLKEMNTWWREIFSEKHRTILKVDGMQMRKTLDPLVRMIILTERWNPRTLHWIKLNNCREMAIWSGYVQS